MTERMRHKGWREAGKGLVGGLPYLFMPGYRNGYNARMAYEDPLR